METPTKPERVEVGQRYTTKFDPFTVTRYNSETDWAVRWDDRLLIGNPESNEGGEGETFAGYCEEFEAVPLSLAPATPGTATVTPCPKPTRVEVGQRWSNPLCDPRYNPSTITKAREYGGEEGEPRVPGFLMRTANGETRHWPADKILAWDYVGRDASEPSVPPYGRLAGELRAPDGTPRTALEAIQAKREPERWVPSCDIDCDIPDADEGWRR